MRLRTSIITTAVVVALAVPAIAASATPKHRYSPVVVTTVYPGTSAISGSCTVTMTAGHVSSFRCPGSTTKVSGNRCTLTVATGRLWTYSCPSGVSGSSQGRIPGSCTAIVETGFLWTFSCPKSAFSGASSTAQAGTGQTKATSVTERRCSLPLTDDYLAGLRCTL